MEGRGNKIIIAIMLITLLGTIGYAKLKPSDNNSNSDIKEPKKEEKLVNPIQPDSQEEKYINYTTAEIQIDGKLLLNITDGLFTMKFNNIDLKLTGINEKIKSFTYDENAFVSTRNNNGVFILLLSETNNIYAGFYEKNDKALYFRKINTNLQIKDITINEIIKTNRSSIKTSVVLENNEIRPIIENGNIYIISNKDVSKYAKEFDNLVIYKDGTLTTKKDLNTKLKYNNQEMIINKILSIKENANNTKCYYIITNNRLFKLCGNITNNINPTTYDNIVLANNKTIISTTNLNIGYIEKEINYEITYDDNTKENIIIEKAYTK